jgi:hypothetical protein
MMRKRSLKLRCAPICEPCRRRRRTSSISGPAIVCGRVWCRVERQRLTGSAPSSSNKGLSSGQALEPHAISLLAILKNRGEEISPRMSDLIVGLHEDWLRLDERIETVFHEIETKSPGGQLLPPDEYSWRRLPADLDSGGSRHRRWRDIRSWQRLRCLARSGAASVQHWRSIDPRPHLQARQPRPVLRSNCTIHAGTQVSTGAPADLCSCV